MHIVDTEYSDGSLKLIDIITWKETIVAPRDLKEMIKSGHKPYGIMTDNKGKVIDITTYRAIKFPSYDEANEYFRENDNCELFNNIAGYAWVFQITKKFEDITIDYCVCNIGYSDITYVSKQPGKTVAYTKNINEAQRFDKKTAESKARAMTKYSKTNKKWIVKQIKTA